MVSPFYKYLLYSTMQKTNYTFHNDVFVWLYFCNILLVVNKTCMTAIDLKHTSKVIYNRKKFKQTKIYPQKPWEQSFCSAQMSGGVKFIKWLIDVYMFRFIFVNRN